MRVLVACEFSGIVRDAFKVLGHDAWSCDILPSARTGQHVQGDVLALLTQRWDLLIAHPPCTYLCSSGLHWNKRRPERAAKTKAALAFVKMLLDADIPRIALENPVGCIGTKIRPFDQLIQPYEFGADASKKTCLWLKGLPRLISTERVQGRFVWHKGKFVERWANQTDSGQNRLGPSEARGQLRAITYQGVADAMAKQWGGRESSESDGMLF